MPERPSAPPPPAKDEAPKESEQDDLAAAKEAIGDAIEALASAYGLIERRQAEDD